MLTDQEVEHIAKLARIELNEGLREQMKKDLSSVLDYAELLQQCNTEGIDPLYQTTGLQNATRPDEHRNDWPMTEELAELLVGQAPQKEQGYVKTKPVKQS